MTTHRRINGDIPATRRPPDESNPAIQWLLDDDNPAVSYRTRREILGLPADKAPALNWLNAFLPADWRERQGLWSVYYLNSFAECGLSFEDTGLGRETTAA